VPFSRFQFQSTGDRIGVVDLRDSLVQTFAILRGQPIQQLPIGCHRLE